MTSTYLADSRADGALHPLPRGSYKVDTSRGERIGRVSSEWFSRPDDERYLSLTALYDAVRGRAERATARTVETRAIRVEARRDDPERLSLLVPGRDRPIAPTHWSFGQLCSLVGAPAGYLRQLPAPLAGINMQHGLHTHRGELIKTLEADDGRVELRAVTGPDYGRIWDHELVAAVMKIAGDGIGDTRWKVPGVLDWSTMTHNPFVEVTRDTTTLYASDRDVFLFLVDDTHPIEAGRLSNGDPDLYFRGFYFFESALAFMAGYGIKGFLIAQSLNQIEKAYGPNNAILDNCHVRVSFATNDERTAKRISDALGTATEMRAMKNYAGHRLSPWLGHLMVSRTETARALLTPGEVMQLPPDQEIVMAAGVAPIRGRKARYYEDTRFTARLLPPPKLTALSPDERPSDDWTGLPPIMPARLGSKPSPVPGKKASAKAVSRCGSRGKTGSKAGAKSDPANAGIRREPDLGDHEEIVARPAVPQSEFEFGEGESDADAIRNRRLQDRMAGTARQASLDPDDGVAL